MTLCPTTNWVGSNSKVEKNWTFGSATSFENSECWNDSFSGYVRVEMWTASPSEWSKAISSRAKFVFPVPASPLTRRIYPFRRRTASSSGGTDRRLAGDSLFSIIPRLDLPQPLNE